MTRLSVNINKIATIRNARGSNTPDVQKAAVDIQLFGAEGITVHPRPDQRHIRYSDVYLLRPLVTTEFNIEGNPEPDFMKLVLDVVPEQVTLVPDSHDALTSSAGWDVLANEEFLREITARLHEKGIRVSIFIDPEPEQARAAAKVGADRVELYTAPYAEAFASGRSDSANAYLQTALAARECGLGINAGHDLDTRNLRHLLEVIPWIDEVSIGHALISDALYLGLEKTVQEYLKETHKL